LDAAAGPGGVAVALISGNPALAAVPASITIPAGAVKSAYFSITTSTVSAPTTVAITAAYAGVSKTANLTLNPASLSYLWLSPNPSVGGGQVLYNNVTLDAPAGPAGATVALSSADATLASVAA